MFCQKCGTEIPEGMNSCPNCNHVNQIPVQAAPQVNRSAAGPGRAQYNMPPHVETHMGKAIFSMLCCCMPLGIVSIVYANQVTNKLQYGDVQGARISSENADKWANISIILGFIFNVISIMLNVISASY